ncbi:hypothetical protein C8F04DRAFT_3182 [Mycena alexandri]|uniref:Uncharacterized protein n=1 Tax=Mycena alexandri TaxID=1745969 RepID=A0AAD6TP01_9AGAR|nr:hypothetical protein C8F04DRAFT_3182 [Mycena alexandri]
MAHLMASPFHKPSPFEFPQRSNSAETVPAANAQLPTPATTSIIGGQDPHAAEYFDTPSASVADPASRFRRAASSIVYHNSGLRESRERTVQRSSRSFVVVLPPPSLPQDHGHLGHTLSSGPRHRLSQGLLMPLFPTMYGQLTAIAREYNFPSTAGLCLYLHFTDNGVTVTPRISDDSWQMIWNHAFDPAPGAPYHSLPISGKIEFDIDMRLARWYGAWMAASHREHVDVPMSVTPSAAPSVVHYREDSRTTFADGDDQDNHDTPPPRAAPRHVPRKLSLIDRFDTMSARSVPRSHVARPSPPDHIPASQKMPPIFQEEEPKTAKYHLEHRVNSWRASSSVLPTAVAAVAAGHILLAGPDLPNSPPLEEESPQPTPTNDEEQEYEYRIEDYAFSISSAGPGDYDPYSPLDWYYDPSVGLAQRAQGSVCMTPSYATSFGPSDYTLSDHVPSLDLNVRTPDIAHRMFEDVPPSPSIATSWGAPLSYPASPMSEHRAPSVDLGHRQEFSRPTTPMTATSWGAPDSYPPSPTTPFYVQTPDAGQRTFDLSALADHDAPWSLVWPYHDTARPWAQVWPYNSDQLDAQAPAAGPSDAPWNMVWPYHSNAAAAREVGQGQQQSSGSAAPWNLVWPYQSSSAAPWNMVWPYHAAEPSLGPVSVTLPVVYPHLNIYPAVYPAFEIYPAVSGVPSNAVDVLAAPGIYPNFDLYPAISASSRKVTARAERGPVTIRLAPAYPVLDLYPATYPGNLDEIYPAVSVDDASWEISTRLAAQYPSFCLYPQVYPYLEIYPSLPEDQALVTRGVAAGASTSYPHFNLYPAIGAFASKRMSSSRGPVTIRLAPAYPVLDLYPATYPWNLDEIYPANFVDDASWEISTRLVARYPAFSLYPAVYPHFDLYPAASGAIFDVRSPGYPDFNLYPAVSRVAKASPRAVIAPAASTSTALLAAGDLSAAVALSPAVSRSRQSPKVRSEDSLGAVAVRLDVAYPVFDLYPALYPLFEIYPALPEDCAPGVRQSPGVSTRLNVGYPIFDLYPAVYPSFEIYPALPEDCAPEMRQNPGVSIRLNMAYPIFDLYPAVYPSFEIYPTLPEDCALGVRQSPGVSIRLNVAYPIFDLYPALYPSFEIYPALPEDCAPGVRESPGVSIRLNVGYPTFDLYPVVYPSFEIYPALPEDCAPGVRQGRGISIRVEPRYPYFNLYPAIYPYFDLWPTLLSVETTAPRFPKQSRFTRSDLHALVKKSSSSFPQRNGGAPSKSHQALHLAVFPEGANVLTPSGGVRLSPRVPSKTHLDLHLSVYPSGVEVSTPSGTGFKDVTVAASTTTSTAPPPSRAPTRLRSGSVLRMSLPPSPRPVGGRSPTTRAPSTTPPAMDLPEPPVEPPRRRAVPAGFPTEPLRRAVSTATRPAPSKGASLSRSVSMAPPPVSVPETTPSLTGPRAIPPRKRDSMVLQRVRALQMNSEPPIKEDDPVANFPLPPRTTVPRKVVS